MSKTVMVETSARHIHVSREDLDILYGKDYQLTNKKDLSQPGQFACEERLNLVGPKGEVEIPVGAIAAKRHIHLTPADAEEMGVVDKQIVSVKVETADRTTTFGDVVVRVHPNFAAAMHIDTDEANAAAIAGTVEGEIIK